MVHSHYGLAAIHTHTRNFGTASKTRIQAHRKYFTVCAVTERLMDVGQIFDVCCRVAEVLGHCSTAHTPTLHTRSQHANHLNARTSNRGFFTSLFVLLHACVLTRVVPRRRVRYA